MSFFIAASLEDIAKYLEELARQRLTEAARQGRLSQRRSEGEATGYQHSASLLREMKWAQDVAAHGFAAPYAIPRDVAKESPPEAPAAPVADPPMDG